MNANATVAAKLDLHSSGPRRLQRAKTPGAAPLMDTGASAEVISTGTTAVTASTLGGHRGQRFEGDLKTKIAEASLSKSLKSQTSLQYSGQWFGRFFTDDKPTQRRKFDL